MFSKAIDIERDAIALHRKSGELKEAEEHERFIKRLEESQRVVNSCDLSKDSDQLIVLSEVDKLSREPCAACKVLDYAARDVQVALRNVSFRSKGSTPFI